jgi:hypothetical protein
MVRTTLEKKLFPVVDAEVLDLYRWSAATTTQFQRANVGPDKRIDTQQTRMKDIVLAAIRDGAVVDRAFIAHYVGEYLRACREALTTGHLSVKPIAGPSREAGAAAVTEQLADLGSVVEEIARELGLRSVAVVEAEARDAARAAAATPMDDDDDGGGGGGGGGGGAAAAAAAVAAVAAVAADPAAAVAGQKRRRSMPDASQS